MSREIKYRAWLKEEEKMVNVSLMSLTEKWIGYHIFYEEEKKKKFEFSDSENFELMQYTGIKDKNDVEIYEGDLVKILDNVNETICEVRFEYGGHILKNRDLREELLYLEERFMEVVGNIYENPELLELLEG